MSQSFEYRGYRVVCSPIHRADDRYDVQTTISALNAASPNPVHRLPGVGAFDSAEQAQNKAALWARQWIDKNTGAPPPAPSG